MTPSETKNWLLKVAQKKKVYLEGNILKLIKLEDESPEFISYVNECIDRDKAARKRRLDVTKEVQKQNKELQAEKEVNDRLMEELGEAVRVADTAKATAVKAKDKALEDLDLVQKKTQFELMNKIVRVALFVIVSVGFLSTMLFMVVLFTDAESAVVESTWANLLRYLYLLMHSLL